MREFTSNEELFEFARSAISTIRASGNAAAAELVEEGLGCVNGLTDGWALFMEQLEKALGLYGDQLSDSVKNDLRLILATATRLVYR